LIASVFLMLKFCYLKVYCIYIFIIKKMKKVKVN